MFLFNKKNISSEYRFHAVNHPGEQFAGNLVLLYGQDYIGDRNNAYSVQTRLPGWFAIGDDSDGRALLMRLDGSQSVYECEHVAMGSVDPQMIATSFADWLSGDCPLPERPEV